MSRELLSHAFPTKKSPDPEHLTNASCQACVSPDGRGHRARLRRTAEQQVRLVRLEPDEGEGELLGLPHLFMLGSGVPLPPGGRTVVSVEGGASGTNTRLSSGVWSSQHLDECGHLPGKVVRHAHLVEG